MPYTSKATLKYAVDGENTDDTSKILSDMKLDVLSKVNIPEEKSYAKANLTFKDQNLFSLEYANTGNLYALKSDEIVTAYLGIRNENLKVLAQKYGIEDASMIPNQIKPIDYKMLLELSEEEKNHIKETYLSVLLNNTNKENYKKEKDLPVNKEGINYIVDAYRLDLNSDEIKNLDKTNNSGEYKYYSLEVDIYEVIFDDEIQDLYKYDDMKFEIGIANIDGVKQAIMLNYANYNMNYCYLR